MSSALDVARYLIELASREPVPEGLTNSRLQCLLYYAQGWHLGAFDRPLFPDRINVGPRGPVVGEVSRAVDAAVGSDPTRVVRPGELGPSGLPFRDRQFVTAIWEKYREFSATGLKSLILGERSWVEPGTGESEDGSENADVSPATLHHYFLRRDELRGFDPTEWEAGTEGEAEYERGEGVPLAEAMRRLRERALSTPADANGPRPTPGGAAFPA
jgi:uncharacterized phage-associated protein